MVSSQRVVPGVVVQPDEVVAWLAVWLLQRASTLSAHILRHDHAAAFRVPQQTATQQSPSTTPYMSKSVTHHVFDVALAGDGSGVLKAPLPQVVHHHLIRPHLVCHAQHRPAIDTTGSWPPKVWSRSCNSQCGSVVQATGHMGIDKSYASGVALAEQTMN